MKINKTKINILFDVKKLEKKSNKNIYSLINELYYIAKKVKNNINALNNKIFNSLTNQRTKKNIKRELYFRNKIYKISGLPSYTTLGIIKLLKKR